MRLVNVQHYCKEKSKIKPHIGGARDEGGCQIIRRLFGVSLGRLAEHTRVMDLGVT